MVHQVFDYQRLDYFYRHFLTDHHKKNFLFEEGARRIFERLEDITRPLESILELGCRQGHLTRLLRPVFPGLKICDRLNLLEESLIFEAIQEKDQLPFAGKIFDAVVSSLFFQGLNDLPGIFSQIFHALKPDGVCLVTCLGGGTLYELQESFFYAQEKQTVVSRVHPMLTLQDMGALAQRSGFHLPVIDVDTLHISYANGLELMHDLKGMGLGNSLMERSSLPLRRKELRDMEQYYAEHFPDPQDPQRILATFQIIYLIAWKPHSSQPKPLKPGQGKISLAEALSPSYKKV